MSKAETTKQDWILIESETKDNVKYQITYITGDEEGIIAYGRVIIFGMVSIKAGLVHSKGGHDFWSFPSKKGKDGEWYSDVVPMSKTAAAILKESAEDAVDRVFEYNEEKAKEENPARRSKR